MKLVESAATGSRIIPVPPRKPCCRSCRTEITDGPNDRCAACAERATEALRARTKNILLHSVPAHYQWASSLAAPELASRVKPASAILAARSSTANTIVLVGPAGSGKTSLATALLVERAVAAVEPEERYGNPYPTRRDEGMFVTTFALAKARREHQLGKGDAGIITHATDAIILLVDELGAEANRGDTAVPEVIHERHAWDRPTIYTTPFELDELERRYGSGIARRVFEGASVIRLGGAR